MTSNPSLFRIRNGIKQRESYARSLGRQFNLGGPHDTFALLNQSQVLDGLINTILTAFDFHSVHDETSFLETIPLDDFRYALTRFLIGANDRPELVEYASQLDCSDAVYSIIVNQNRSPSGTIVDESGIALSLHQEGLLPVIQPCDLRRLPEVAELRCETLQEIVFAISKAAKTLILATGPGPLTVLRRLFDPKDSCEDLDLRRELKICAQWGLGDIAVRIALIRPELHGQIAKLSDEIGESLSAETRASLDRIMRVAEGGDRAGSEDDILCKIATILKQIERACKRSDIPELCARIISLYDLDRDAIAYIDWTSVHTAVEFSPPYNDPQMVFVFMLAGMPANRVRHRVAQMTYGDGAWLSALTVGMATQPDKISYVAKEIKKVPGKARIALAESVVSSTSVSMLMNAMQHQPAWVQPLLKVSELRDDVKLSSLRSDLARGLAAEGVISMERAQQVVTEEEAALEITHLRSLKMLGALQVDWDQMGQELFSQIADRLRLTKQMLAGSDGARGEKAIKGSTAVISLILARQITDSVILDGPDNLKTNISDALRHGQLLSHFISAFQDGTKVLRRRSNRQSYERQVLDELQLDLSGRIRRFNEKYLNVDNGSDFHNLVLSEVSGTVASFFSSKSDDVVAVVSDVIDCFKKAFNEFLKTARQELRVALDDYIEHATHELDQLKSVELSGRDVAGQPLKDQLSVDLRNATEEAVKWIAISDPSEKVIKFKFSHVVRLLTFNQGVDKIGLVHPCFVEIRPVEGDVILPQEPYIAGIYHPLVESVCKNLLPNALNYSGLGQKNRVEIEFHHSKDQIKFVCRNHVSPARLRKLQAEAPALIAAFAKPDTRKAAGEGGSGFPKISSTLGKGFHATPELQINYLRNPLRAQIVVSVRHKKGSMLFETDSPD